MRVPRTVAWLPWLALLAACGSSPEGEGVGGVTASEASALNEAAATLDARSGVADQEHGGSNPAAVAAARADRDRLPPREAPAAP